MRMSFTRYSSTSRPPFNRQDSSHFRRAPALEPMGIAAKFERWGRARDPQGGSYGVHSHAWNGVLIIPGCEACMRILKAEASPWRT